MEIKNAVALVTGANRGIGRALVEHLLARGASKVYATTRRPGELQSLAAAHPSRVVPLQLDITDEAQVLAAAETAPDVTLLFNNAGVLDFGSALDVPAEAIRRNMETNYFGTLSMARAFAPVLEANGGGAVVNILTLVALASMPGLAVYNASKAAAWSITQSLRADLAPRGIQVIGVFPGAVDTDMLKGVEMAKTQPSDVAGSVLDGVEAGTEDLFPDPMSASLYEAWRTDHKSVERQFATM